MAQAVSASVAFDDADSMERVSYNGRDSRTPERPDRGDQREEQAARRAGWPDFEDVAEDRLADPGGQRVGLRAARLGAADP